MKQIEKKIIVYASGPFGSKDIIHRVRAHYLDSELHSKTEHVQVFDTFDFRLKGNGLNLQIRDGNRFVLRSSDWKIESTYEGEFTPVFSNLFPIGIRKHLDPIVDHRRLHEQKNLELKVSECRLLNREKKTILRLFATEKMGTPVFELERMEGYGNEFRKIKYFLENELGLVRLGENPAFDYPGKKPSLLRPVFDGQSPPGHVDTGKRILGWLLNVMEENEAGILEDQDDEHLHDFRVAVRRARTLLARFSSAFPEEKIESWKEVFAFLGSGTTPLRDLDVHLIQFDSYRKVSKHPLEPLRSSLLARREIEYLRVRDILTSEIYKKMKAEIHVWNQGPTGSEQSAPGQVASRAIRKSFRRLQRYSRSIRKENLPDRIHEIRKEAKKLRYLMEFFQDFFDAKNLQIFITRVKEFQDILGEHQDAYVQRQDFVQMGARLEEEANPDKTMRKAMDRIIRHAEKRMNRTLQVFKKEVGRFPGKTGEKLFDRLFSRKSY